MSSLVRYCFALDLKDDKKLISEYDKYHQKIWPEIKASIVDSGIENLEIYRAGNRLFMILEADPSFSLAEKARSDEANPKVQEWEKLMWTYQQALPFADPGQKWVMMKKIFDLARQ